VKQYADTHKLFGDLTGAVISIQVYTLYLIVFMFLAEASSDAQWFQADPILKIFPKQATLWSSIVLSLAMLLLWCGIQHPTKDIIFKSFKHSAYGLTAAIILILTMRLIVGPNMPTFIPPEESVKPGYLLGMSAGFSEELIFRLGLTPLIFISSLKYMQVHYAGIFTILVVALLFALLHEIGSAGEAFSAYYFMARFIVPGCIMGLAFFYISPTFIVMMHCTAHIMIPLLFL